MNLNQKLLETELSFASCRLLATIAYWRQFATENSVSTVFDPHLLIALAFTLQSILCVICLIEVDV